MDENLPVHVWKHLKAPSSQALSHCRIWYGSSRMSKENRSNLTFTDTTRVQISIRAVGYADTLASKQKAEKSIMLPSRCRTTDLYWRSQPKSHHFEIDPWRAHNMPEISEVGKC
jgi:hypothetical protein